MDRLWDLSNLHAWCVSPYDDTDRDAEQRADMLARLGFRRYACLFFLQQYPQPGPALDAFVRAELDALAARGIELLSWWWPWEAGDPIGNRVLEIFGECGVRPRLWLMQRWPDPLYDEIPNTPDAHRRRVDDEARRVLGVTAHAARHGIDVDLYNHNGWFGIMENQLAVLERAHELGAEGLGLNYNFSHVRDHLHDDTTDFASVWALIQDRVTSINLAGTHVEDGTTLLPGEGDAEEHMMQVVQDSGWSGPVGVIAESGGDAESTLADALAGMSKLAARLLPSEEPRRGNAPW
jgi:sugar phosphate isomerase/epimerase